MTDQSSQWLQRVVRLTELALAAILVVMVIVSVAVIVADGLEAMQSFPPGDVAGRNVIKDVLQTFIVIELFHITVAYLRRSDVLPTVLTTGIVVVAREIVANEAGKEAPLFALTVGFLLIAISLSWFLLRRAGAFQASSGQEDAGGENPERG